MGKKARQESLKTSNNDNKKQVHNLIKVLRPKVYIIDSSSFKSLVQELTGNGSISSTLSPQTPSISSPISQNDSIIDVQSYLEPESSRDASNDSSNHQASITEQEPSPWYYQSSVYNDITSNCLVVNEEVGLSGCEDLESLLLDIDNQYSWSNNYDDDMFNHDQLGKCDYEWSGLLD